MRTKVKIVLKEGAVVPVKSYDGDACYDLVLSEDVLVGEGKRVVLPLGFKIELPDPCSTLGWKVLSWLFGLPSYRYMARVNPRSGMTAKGMVGHRVDSEGNIGKEERFDMDVEPGIIDSNYRDLCGVLTKNHDCRFLIKRGTKVAQMSIERAYEAEFLRVGCLSQSERDGGFGSTGTKI